MFIGYRAFVVAGMAACSLCVAFAQIGPRIAIVAAATNTADPQNNTRFTDARDMLVADGRFSQVDIINTTPFGGGGTPTLATLLQYDAVLHWTNVSNADSVALGNVMADYVDAGGGVVVAVFANTSTHEQRFLRGRWLTGNYEIIPSQGGHLEGPAPGATGTSGFVRMGSRLDPLHPVFDNVGDVRLNWLTTQQGQRWGAYRPVTTAVHPWARKLSLWEDGRTAVAIHNLNEKRIDLGLHPVSDLVAAGYYDRTSDAGRLIANAMYHSAVVPEPTTLAVLGLGALALVRRRKGR
jgi:hypothetical protein